MTTGEKIQYYRKQKNLSQEQMGQMLYVSRQTVSLWEKDQTQPTIENLLKLKEIFGVSVDELLSGEVRDELTECDRIDEPLESFSVVYQKDDIRRANIGIYKNRMIRMMAATILFLIMFVYEMTRMNPVMIGFTGGAFAFAVIMISMNFLKLKSIIRIGEIRTMNREFFYDIYENYLIQTIQLNGEEVVRRKIMFSEISRVMIFGELIVFVCEDRFFILKVKIFGEDSRFYRFLLSHSSKANGKRVKR